MEAQILTKQGLLAEALAQHKRNVAAKPSDAHARWFPFQLFCFQGDWKRARDQLGVASQLDREYRDAGHIYNRVMAAEHFRPDVLAGKRTPLLMGEPEHWLANLFEANRLLADGEVERSTEFRQKAFNEMPALKGELNGQAIEWISDQDSRFGANLECFFQGKYYWIPMSRVRALRIHAAPTSYTEVLYPRAHLTLANDGELDVLLFARYPSSQPHTDEGLALNRLTRWEDINDYTLLGSGQRVFITDQNECPVLEIRSLVFN